MLRYEEILHLDKHYEKLRNNSLLIVLSSLFASLVTYIFFYYLLRYCMNYLPNKYAWEHSNKLFTIGEIRFLTVDIVYFLGGIITFCIGVIRIIRITKENHSVMKQGIPSSLLTCGYYLTQRHPMYGSFLLLYSGLMLSTRSLYGIIIIGFIIISQYINIFFEERKLHSLFKNEFLLYCNKTKRKLMTDLQIVILTVTILVTIWGL